jgi:hypothetical protein
MRSLLSAAGRAFLRDFAITFLAFASGILNAPNFDQARALAAAASLASLVAAFRAVRVFVPGISSGVANMLRVPVAYAEVVITGITTVGMGFLALAEGVLSAPDFEAGKAAALAAVLGVGTALVRLAQAFLTPGETPSPNVGIEVPAQPVPAAALPPTM